ncbi:ankyrin repeat domain-containing protein [Sphingomicrobium flavum]|uniref:ankyrin repeat domain-containing protein n=1 Tax=Sphingomicrobium flavum TaxID=1229164 RepID=UPI0021ADC63A|nr:ankyrin repeat domain-containing protein [Sphingomicrobium flavum]
MAKAKRKTLPKDFEELLQSADVSALKSIFDTVDVDARGGVFKQTALAFNSCPDELSRWLVDRGADLNACDNYGETPLHARSGHWRGNIAILLELGADVHHSAEGRGTPLHRAAAVGNLQVATMLLEHGANPDAVNSSGQSPLIFALAQSSNATIERLAPMAELLLSVMNAPPAKKSLFRRLFGGEIAQSSVITPEMQRRVENIGANFEFHRAGYNPNSVDAASDALDHLYRLFEVKPVARRSMHDGKSNITSNGSTWQEQHHEFWEMLVPSTGAAPTVQGEVIRISGRICDEIERNGGVNWDADYREMANALKGHLESGNSLPAADLDAASDCVAEITTGKGDPSDLCRLAVNWVELNPKPVSLGIPSYNR